MNKTKQSYKRIFNFIANANVYLKMHPEETKLKYAIERTGENLNDVGKDYNKKLKDIKLELAYSDEKGKVPFTVDEQGERVYDYTKENLKKLDEQIEKLYESEIEIEVYHATELPDDLEEGFKKVFEGFVIA